jgi:hypothetical protein
VTTLQHTQTLTVVTCWCGMAHAIPKALDEWADSRPDNSVYCPLGHKWVRRDGPLQRAERELKNAQDLLARREAQLRTTEASRRATLGQLTKERKRVNNGVCPVCNRTFVALGRHMHTKHPDFTEAPTE